MVALHDEDFHPRTPQAHHLFAHEQPGVKILPVAVVQVAGDQHKVHFLVDGQIHQPNQGLSGGTPQAGHRGALKAVEPAQGAVNVQICGVKEAHANSRVDGW